MSGLKKCILHVFLISVSLFLLFGFAAGSTAQAADLETVTRTELFQKVNGVKQSWISDASMSSQGCAVTVSVDVPNSAFGYVGFNSAQGKGLPASSTRGIGILLYNSTNSNLAVEVYSGYSWKQLTTTTVLKNAQTDVVSLCIKKVDGVWGLYIDGVLFLGVAKTDIDDVAAGDTFNPVAYIAESEFSDNGQTFVEIGTWSNGGSISLYKNTLSGVIDVVDRDYNAIAGLRIKSAVSEEGNEISLLDCTMTGTRFSLSTLSGENISSLEVETAGGISRSAVLGERTVIRGKDVKFRFLNGEAVLGGLSFALKRGEQDVTEYIKFTESDGIYTFEDIGTTLELVVSRAGFETNNIWVNPQFQQTQDIPMQEKTFEISLRVMDGYTGNMIPNVVENLTLLGVDGTPLADASIREENGLVVISGLHGSIGDCSIHLQGRSGYADASVKFSEYDFDREIVLYTSRTFDSVVSVKDGNGTVISGATVTAVIGGEERIYSETPNSYELTGCFGDFHIAVKKGGYASRYLIVSSGEETTVTLSDAFPLRVSAPGVSDGTEVSYAIDGLIWKKTSVSEEWFTIEEIGVGNTLKIVLDGYVVEKDTFEVEETEVTLSVRKIEKVKIYFTYLLEPAAQVKVAFDKFIATTDEEGAIELTVVGTEVLKLLTVDGYRSFSADVLTLTDTDVTVELNDKFYNAVVWVRDQNGNPILDRELRLEDGTLFKRQENGSFIVVGLFGEHTVYLGENDQSLTISAECPEAVFTVAEGSVAPPVSNHSGCSKGSAETATLLCALGVIVAAGKRFF